MGWVCSATACVLLSCGCSRSPDQQFQDAVQLVRDGKTNVIDFREKPITGDQTLEKLAQTVGLRKLNLDNSPVTDAGLRALGPMPDLRDLSLTRSLITEDAVSIIVNQFPNLEHLRLDATAITDKHLDKLSQLTSLERLSLYRTRITDGSCEHLAKITSLRTLSLDQTRITNAGLKALQDLPELKSLSVWKTAVTDAGADEFLKAKPEIKLNR